MDFSNPNVFIYGGIMTLGIYLIRPFAVKMTFGRKEKLDIKEKTLLEILIPKGLAAAVLAQLSVQSGVLGERATEFGSLILSVIFLSIFLTSILIFLTEKRFGFKGIFLFFEKGKCS